MIPLADLLRPDHVELQPHTTSLDDAIAEIAGLLKNDVRVLDWEEVHEGMRSSAPCIVEQGAEFGICIPHVRSDGVTALAISIGRFEPGLIVPNIARPIRYLFCIAAPHALGSDYLRVVGLLSRIAKDPQSEAAISAALTAEEFVEELARLEAKL